MSALEWNCHHGNIKSRSLQTEANKIQSVFIGPINQGQICHPYCIFLFLEGTLHGSPGRHQGGSRTMAPGTIDSRQLQWKLAAARPRAAATHPQGAKTFQGHCHS